jgi:hypothetical protein
MATTQAARRTTNRKPRQQELEHEEPELRDMVDYLKDYAREKPEVAAIWCLGIGFILGWKLKIW